MKLPIKQLFFLGRPLSPIYSFLMSVRSKLYTRTIFKTYSLPVPVISVGNLTMGGTGKTPTVRMIAKYLQKNGWQPGIISRGYKGTAKDRVNVVSDGQTVLLTAEQAGDEPFMLAQSCSDVPVLTGSKRVFPCQYAVEQFSCDILILDDGFQHMAVNRDFNIVLFNGTTLAGNSRVFPGGELREPVSALNRADCFLITGVNEVNNARSRAFRELLEKRFARIPAFLAEDHVDGILDQDGFPIDSGDTRKNFLAFCGIAHPERFFSLLDRIGITVKSTIAYKDHTPYSQQLLNNLAMKAEENEANALITTEKDMVKINTDNIDLPIYHTTLETKTDPAFFDILAKAIGRKTRITNE